MLTFRTNEGPVGLNPRHVISIEPIPAEEWADELNGPVEIWVFTTGRGYKVLGLTVQNFCDLYNAGRGNG